MVPPHRGERRAAQAGSVPEEGARRRTGRRGTRCSGSRRGAGQSLGFPPSLNGAGPVVFGTQPVVSSPDVFCVGFASSRFALGWVGRFLCAAAQMKPVHWVVGFLSLVGWLVRDECMGIGEAAPRVCLAGSPHRRAPVHGRAGVAEGGEAPPDPCARWTHPTPLGTRRTCTRTCPRPVSPCTPSLPRTLQSHRPPAPLPVSATHRPLPRPPSSQGESEIRGDPAPGRVRSRGNARGRKASQKARDATHGEHGAGTP